MTAAKDSDIKELINSILHYDVLNNLAICRPCGTVLPKDIQSHFRKHHNALSNQERQGLCNHVQGLNAQTPEAFLQSISADIPIPAIKHLPVHDILQCDVCGLLGGDTKMLIHCQSEYEWTKSQGTFYIVVLMK